MCNSFFNGLPQVATEANAKLEVQLYLDELYTALMSMQRAPGIDGLPVDFYKFFWSGKSKAVVVGDRQRDQLKLPGGLVLKKGGRNIWESFWAMECSYRETGTMS